MSFLPHSSDKIRSRWKADLPTPPSQPAQACCRCVAGPAQVLKEGCEVLEKIPFTFTLLFTLHDITYTKILMIFKRLVFKRGTGREVGEADSRG